MASSLIVIQCTNTNMDGKWLDSSQLPTIWGRELPPSQTCIGTGYFVRAIDAFKEAE